jgi:alanyl-tRNA synthetase
MTERLYYEDATRLEFEAEVSRCEEAAGGVRVYLDRTAFYPGTGGQLADAGTLAGQPVIEVGEDAAGDIYHLLAHPPDGARVQGRVDADRRFDHMQQHTGQHILSEAFVRLYRLGTVGFHMSRDVSTIDLATDRLDDRQLAEALRLANAVAWADRPVETSYHDATETGGLGLRKPTRRDGEVRVISVEDFDRSACGGTHVARTGQVGVIAVTRTERLGDKLRVHFLCGGRVARAFQDYQGILSALCAMATTGIPELPAKMEKLLQSVKALERETAKLKGELQAERAPAIREQHRSADGISRVVLTLDEPAEIARALCQKLITGDHRTLAAVVSSPAGTVFVGRTPDLGADMQALVAELRAAFGAKGGGRPDFAQLGGLAAEALPAVAERIRAWHRTITG